MNPQEVFLCSVLMLLLGIVRTWFGFHTRSCACVQGKSLHVVVRRRLSEGLAQSVVGCCRTSWRENLTVARCLRWAFAREQVRLAVDNYTYSISRCAVDVWKCRTYSDNIFWTYYDYMVDIRAYYRHMDT